MRVRHQLQADKGIMFLKMDLLLGQFEEVVGPFLDVMIGGDKKSAGTGGRVLDNFAGLRLHEPHDAIDERARGKILPDRISSRPHSSPEALRKDCRTPLHALKTSRARRSHPSTP